jgi:hypothetical protein
VPDIGLLDMLIKSSSLKIYKMTKTNIILSFCIIILLLVIYYQREKIVEYQTHYDYFQTKSIEYQRRITEIENLIYEIERKEFILDTIQNNLQEENDFLLMATPEEMFARYFPNEINIGGK